MRFWLPQLALIAGILLFLGRLPALGSPAEALLAATLAVGTVAAVCALYERLRTESFPGPRRAPLAPEADA
jgi:hypothetical protein